MVLMVTETATTNKNRTSRHLYLPKKEKNLFRYFIMNLFRSASWRRETRFSLFRAFEKQGFPYSTILVSSIEVEKLNILI